MAAILTACATEQAQKATPEPATGTEVQKQTEKQDQQGGQAKIDGANILVMKGRSGPQLSLLDALKSTGKKAAIYQFAGVDCTECFALAKGLESMIKASPKGKDI